MNSPRFIHLRLHSEFSITDGIVRLDDAIKRAIQDKMPAVGMSDLMNIFGMVKFYKERRDKGIKPIVSCDIWLENEDDRDKPYRMMLTVKNRQGYGRLCELLADAYTHNQYRGRAEIKRAWLENGDNSGLICLSGAHLGDVGQALLQGSAMRLAGSRILGALLPRQLLPGAATPGQSASGARPAGLAMAGRRNQPAGGGHSSHPVHGPGRFQGP